MEKQAENTVFVRLKIIADDRKKTNLLKTEFCLFQVSKSSSLQDAIILCIKENSTISSQIEVTPQHISDVSYMENRDGELEDITAAIELSLEELQSQGLKLGMAGYKFIASMNHEGVLNKAPSKQSRSFNPFPLMMSSQNTKSYLVPEIQNIHLPFLKVQNDCDEALSEEALEQLQALAFDKQVHSLLRSYIEQFGFGYSNDEEKKSLETFVDLYAKSLQFVERFWNSLLQNDFPSIPSQYSTVHSLQLLKLTQRKKNSKDRMDSSKLKYHIDNIEKAKPHLPNYSKGSTLRKKMQEFKNDDIDKISNILNNAYIRLEEDRSRHSNQKPSTAEDVEEVIRTSLDYITVDPARNASNSNEKKFTTDILKSINSELKQKDLYKPLVLSDAFLGLDDKKYSSNRREYRRMIKNSIKGGKLKYSVILHTYSIGGQYSDLLTIFRVPSKIGRKDSVDAYTAEVTKAIATVRKNATTIELKQTCKAMDTLLRTVSSFDLKQKQQLANILELEAKDLEDILNMHGETIDEEVLQDQRYLNSRGGKGDGHTDFQIFFDKCKDILHSKGAAEERRHGSADIVRVHGSTVTSLRDLRNQAIEQIRKDVEKGILTEEPPYPSESSIALQFSPSYQTVKAAKKFTGRLEVNRKVQIRTLRHQHPDQHFVNAATKYFKEHLVDCRNQAGRKHVRFYGQDDKAKIPVGADVAISTGARRVSKAIVPANPSLNTNYAADHDWSNASIITSVTLHGNVPNDYLGTFFGGGEEGDGEITVTLNDATFHKSDVFVHTAQLLLDLRTRPAELGSEKSAAEELMVLLLQTDGGPDHNLTFLRSRLALLGLFLLLDVDAMNILRGAPQGSSLNTVERSMSILNLGLCDLALLRGIMPPWAETLVANLNSMKEVRDAHEKNELRKKRRAHTLENMEKRKARGDFSLGNTIENVHVEINDFSSLGLKFLLPKGDLPQVKEVLDNSQCKELVHLGDELLLVGEANLKNDGNAEKFRSIIKKEMGKKKPFHLLLLRKKTVTQKPETNNESCEEKKEEEAVMKEVNEAEQLGVDTALQTEVVRSEDKEEEAKSNGESYNTSRLISNLSNADDASNVQEDAASSVKCSYPGCTYNFKLEKCAAKGCSKVSHHLCQNEFAARMLLEEKGTHFCCIHHIHEYYNTNSGQDTLENMDSRFTPAANAATCRRISRTAEIKDRPSTYPTAKEVQSLVQDAANDPRQLILQSTSHSSNVEEKDLRKEWLRAMDKVIQQLRSRFSRLELCGRPVKVVERATDDTVNELHSKLSVIDPGYNKNITDQARFSREMPLLSKFLADHVVFTPYSAQFRKCGSNDCVNPRCSNFRSSEEDRDLILQLQPAPTEDPAHRGHFLSRADALKKAKNNPIEAATDLRDLPSKKEDPSSDRDKKKVDTGNGKKVHSWKPTAVRDTVTCIECGKPRCLFSKNELSKQTRSLLEKAKEADYVCGSFLINQNPCQNHPLREVIYQRIALNCDNAVEKEYYNPKPTNNGTSGQRQSFKTRPICHLCISEENLVSGDEVANEVNSGGKKCLMTCRRCLKEGEKVVCYGTANQIKKRKQQQQAKEKSKKAKRSRK